jgi:hypothetical protein
MLYRYVEREGAESTRRTEKILGSWLTLELYRMRVLGEE